VSYHIYTTDGIVLNVWPKNESDRIYSILTRDFGLIRARALGVRKEASKLRGSLEPFCLSKVSLVRGKEYWRTTSAESVQSISFSPAIARPLVLLSKLVQGESPNPELFDTVSKALISKGPDEELFEIHLVSQILYHLGYMKKEDLELDKKSLVKAINEGIQASHL